MDGMPSALAQLPQVGEEIAAKYRIEGVLGQGGMGAVFSARNLMTGKRVAIKWLLPEHASGTNRERLLREARIACSVEHPNVVDIYDVGEHQGGLFLVMELLRGKTLADVLAERGRFDPIELIGVLVPAMRGVHAAHQAGVIHRDLKPENILLSEVDGQVIPKVVDFGVSKTVGASSVPHSSLTRTGALVGTPHYMALEQVDGSNQIDPRTDVYAFGVIMYRALTGHFPFDGSSLGEVILKIGTKDPAPPRTLRADLPVELEAVILRAMSRVRAQRFRDCEELARSLEPFAPWVRFRETGVDPTGRIVHAQASAEPRMLTPVESTGLQADTVSAQGIEARVTPELSVEHAQRTRAFWIGIAIGLVAVVSAVAWLLQRAPAERTVHLEPPAPPVSAPVREAVQPTTPSAPAAVAAPEPAPSEAPSLAPLPSTPEPAPVSASPASTESVREDVERASSKSRSRVSEHGHAPKLIPGERTKGLSADDF